MKTRIIYLLLLFCAATMFADSKAQRSEVQQRRQRAAAVFRDGLLFIHASSELSIAADGFRQDPFFYYYTALENTPGAILVIDGPSGESWLFVPDKVPFSMGMTPEASPSAESAKVAGIEHVVASSELENFLSAHANTSEPVYYISDPLAVADLPTNMQRAEKNGPIPLWIATITQRSPNLRPTDVYDRIHFLTAVESATEITSSRQAAKATVNSFFAGLAAIKPGVSQRSVESTVENACWLAGAHGSSFWPWVMTGQNAVFPRPFWSMSRYDHLDTTLRAGELVRFDIGCEWEHYGGDLGRTVPVSGKYTPEQREIWDALVAAYRAAAKTLREGTREDQVFASWREELLHQRQLAMKDVTKRAIEFWADRKNVPYWQMHTMNLDAGFIEGPLRAGMVIDFEPIVSFDSLGFYLEDMFLITKDGAEDLTPGIPFTADEIETVMRGANR